MTSLTEAQRNAMLHERVAVLERDKREMNEAYSAKCRETRELREELACVRNERDELKARCERYVERLKGDGR